LKNASQRAPLSTGGPVLASDDSREPRLVNPRAFRDSDLREPCGYDRRLQGNVISRRKLRFHRSQV